MVLLIGTKQDSLQHSEPQTLHRLDVFLHKNMYMFQDRFDLKEELQIGNPKQSILYRLNSYRYFGTGDKRISILLFFTSLNHFYIKKRHIFHFTKFCIVFAYNTSNTCIPTYNPFLVTTRQKERRICRMCAQTRYPSFDHCSDP